MKRLLILFVVALFVMFCVPAQAATLADKKYTIDNSTGTGSLTTLIPITLLRPGKDRIVRITCTPQSTGAGAHYENIVAIYDSASISGLIGTKAMEGEVERSDDTTSELSWDRGLAIYNGGVIAQGAKTIVNVEWEQIPR